MVELDGKIFEMFHGWVLRAMGNNVASLAQLKHAGGGVEHGGTVVKGGETRDRGCKMGPGESSDMLVAMKDGGDNEVTCQQLSWGAASDMVCFGGWVGKQGGLGSGAVVGTLFFCSHIIEG